MYNTEITDYAHVTEQICELKEYFHSFFNELLEIQNEIAEVKSSLEQIDKKINS